jgi:hypothetical protein
LTVVRISDNFKHYSTVYHLLIRLANIYLKLKTNNTTILIDEKYQYCPYNSETIKLLNKFSNACANRIFHQNLILFCLPTVRGLTLLRTGDRALLDSLLVKFHKSIYVCVKLKIKNNFDALSM